MSNEVLTYCFYDALTREYVVSLSPPMPYYDNGECLTINGEWLADFCENVFVEYIFGTPKDNEVIVIPIDIDKITKNKIKVQVEFEKVNIKKPKHKKKPRYKKKVYKAIKKKVGKRLQ
jgi:hypothetical protein